MSKYDGTVAGTKAAEAARKPFVVEAWSDRSFSFTPVRGARFESLGQAIAKAQSLSVKAHVVSFDPKTRKPLIAWGA